MTEPRWESLSSVVQERFTEENLRKRRERLKTGFPGLDELLGGGICPGLIVLGGSPNLGKSTFAIQLSEAVSAQTPVLYFSLEMTEERIASKLMSRYLFLERDALQLGEGECLSGDRLLSGMSEQNPWRPELLRAIEQARLHEEAVLKDLFIIAEPLSAAQIVKTAESFLAQRRDLASPPLVVVDYLQILPPSGARSWNEKQAVEDSLKHMAGLAHKGIPVILISSLSRGSYKVPMEISSFKETGGIEYSADILLGLQFQACHEKHMDLSAEKDKVPRQVELFVLKQRYGKSDCGIRLEYYSAHDCFVEEAASAGPRPECPKNGGEPASYAAASADCGPLEAPAASGSEGQETARPEEAGQAQRPERDKIPRSVMCNTKIANQLRQGASGSGRQCEVFRGVYTEYDLLPEPLSCFDCDVADAIYTLLSKYRRDSFSVGQVLRSLSGDERQTLTEQKKREIIKSIERLRSASVSIRCEEEMQRRESRQSKPLSGIQSFQGQFLNVRLEQGRYVFERGPAPVMPLYAYGEMTSQMISFPRDLLHVRANGRKLSDTSDTVCVKRYLIRRLEILRNKGRKGDAGFRYISFREDRELAALLKLYDHYPAKESRAQKRRKLQATVLQVLSYYREIGYIHGFQMSPQTQTVTITGSVRDPWKLSALLPEPSSPASAPENKI